MEIGLILPKTDATTRTEFAARADSAGFESVWVGEMWGENAFAHLAEVAKATDDVTIGPSIVNVYSRTPAVLAMGAYSLDRISDHRAVIGVGVSTAKAIETVHDMALDRPVRRTHETVELMKRFLDGETSSTTYHGEIFQIRNGPSLDADVPIYNAALGPANCRATGRVADGWMPYNIPFQSLDEAYETIERTASRNDRDPDEIAVKPRINVLIDDDVDAARDGIRGTVAYYVGSGDGYKNAVGRAYPDEVETIASEWRTGNHQNARAAVTDEMCRDLGVFGPTDRVRGRLTELIETTQIDVPVLDIPSQLDDDSIERTYAEVATFA
jgi:alkanesulfonate monooxygenase SsuD/methylene tetrahydromethanopterin reductase-like flavin-dependent oxidoreductase (luciferase family)